MDKGLTASAVCAVTKEPPLQTCLGTQQSKQGKPVAHVSLVQHRKVKALKEAEICARRISLRAVTESVTQGLEAPSKNIFETLPAD